MSLHAAAKHLASRGRGPDTELVHMTRNEIKGLQSLAKSAGGSLTVNPDTGLVEAGFLESILPMVAGIGLSFIPGVGPLAAAAIVGAGTGVATGSLEKGLMAGLGAYGGASLGAGLAEAGVSTLAEQGGATATNLGNEAVNQAATQALPAGYDVAGSGFSPAEMLQGSNPGAANSAIQSTLTPQNFANLAPEQLTQIQNAVPNMANPTEGLRAAGMANATTDISRAQAIQAGLPQIGSVAANNAMPLIGTAGQMLADSQYTKSPTYDIPGEEKSKLQRLSPNFRAQGPVQPNPYYRAQYPTYGASGGEVRGLAMGGQPSGPIEQMSQNMMGGQGNMYPQSQQEHTNFAVPTQMPASAEVIRSDYDAKTDPYTGVMMAGGGIARYAPGGQLEHLPVKGVYSDSDPDTAKKPADEAAMIRLNKILAAANMKKSVMPKTNMTGLGDLTPIKAAQGGHLGGYSDGGRMLKGPGDGMSDNIPATIGGKQPARLADGEFVVPADVVSHLGNGSTDAGARKLYKMMERIRVARTGKKKQAPSVKTDKYLPA